MQDRLDLAREAARQRMVVAVKDRKLRYDKGSCVRSFDIGNLCGVEYLGWTTNWRRRGLGPGSWLPD